MSTAIETEPSGMMFDYDNPRSEQVDIRDIARALSNSCRFGGLCKSFYSVAEHALLVHALVDREGWRPSICYAALHHDSHEAYTTDVPSPLKQWLGQTAPGVWRGLEDRIDKAICDALEVDFDLMRHKAIKTADAKALLIEAAVVKTSQGVGLQWKNYKPVAGPPWAMTMMRPALAEERFLAMHKYARSRCQP